MLKQMDSSIQKKKKETPPPKDLNRYFTTKDIYITNKHMKRCFTPLDIREMKI